jgi:hypothetical protein
MKMTQLITLAEAKKTLKNQVNEILYKVNCAIKARNSDAEDMYVWVDKIPTKDVETAVAICRAEGYKCRVSGDKIYLNMPDGETRMTVKDGLDLLGSFTRALESMINNTDDGTLREALTTVKLAASDASASLNGAKVGAVGAPKKLYANDTHVYQSLVKQLGITDAPKYDYNNETNELMVLARQLFKVSDRVYRNEVKKYLNTKAGKEAVIKETEPAFKVEVDEEEVVDKMEDLTLDAERIDSLCVDGCIHADVARKEALALGAKKQRVDEETVKKAIEKQDTQQPRADDLLGQVRKVLRDCSLPVFVYVDGMIADQVPATCESLEKEGYTLSYDHHMLKVDKVVPTFEEQVEALMDKVKEVLKTKWLSQDAVSAIPYSCGEDVADEVVKAYSSGFFKAAKYGGHVIVGVPVGKHDKRSMDVYNDALREIMNAEQGNKFPPQKDGAVIKVDGKRCYVTWVYKDDDLRPGVFCAAKKLGEDFVVVEKRE